MLIKCLTSPLMICLFLLLLLYGVLAFSFDSKHMIEFTDGLDISFALAVTWVYRRRVVDALCHKHPDVYDLLLTGIAGGWFVNAMDRGWRLVARVTNNYSLLEHHFIGFMLTGLMFFAALHLLVRGSANEGRLGHGVSSEALRFIICAAVFGSLIGAAAVTYSVWYD